MSKIKVANCVGFCHGVRRAVDLTRSLLEANNRKVYCLGPVIHNSKVMELLADKGLKIVKDINSVKNNGVLILSSHGTAKDLIEEIQKKDIRFIDAICPYVLSVQKICLKLKNDGYKIVIVGDKEHPETRAILSNVSDAIVIDKFKDLKDNLKAYPKVGVISQTTQLKEKFIQVADAIKKHNPDKDIRIFNTICLDTIKRQKEARGLAGAVDVMFVVGGHDSANTRRLVDLCRKLKVKTYHIQGPEDIKGRPVVKNRTIGITSGASTPDWLVQKVIERLRIAKNNKIKKGV